MLHGGSGMRGTQLRTYSAIVLYMSLLFGIGFVCAGIYLDRLLLGWLAGSIIGCAVVNLIYWQGDRDGY